MAGTGQKIVPPDFLKEYRPHTVIIMNPVYRSEIGAWLTSVGLTSELLNVDQVPSRGAAI